MGAYPHRTVYPRVCGGTEIGEGAVEPVGGLSPRVRGNLAEGLPGLRLQGSIPACAGEPLGLDAEPAFVGVYPRVCGGTQCY